MQGAQLNETTNTLQVPSGSSPPSSPTSDTEDDEPPIPTEQIEPLVRQVIEDYSNASLLLRLPGCIPIPAFDTDVPMPAENWTNLEAHSFKENIMDLLARDTEDIPACTCASSSFDHNQMNRINGRRRKRKVINTPLIARPVAEDIYSREKRSRILSSLGIPEHQHDQEKTKILVVSFGGQSIPKPSASRPPTPLPPSRNGSISMESGVGLNGLNGVNGLSSLACSNGLPSTSNGHGESSTSQNSRNSIPFPSFQHTINDQPSSPKAIPLNKSFSQSPSSPSPRDSPTEERTPPISANLTRAHTAAPRLQRLMTEDHIYLPGAPPALHRPHQLSATSMKMRQSTSSSNASHNSSGGTTTKHRRKISLEIPKIYQSEDGASNASVTVEEQIELSIVERSAEGREIEDNLKNERHTNGFGEHIHGGQDIEEGADGGEEEQLIPKGWIAIVCGLSVKDGADELPENFYAAPRDVYVPDLTAICDVLLGKLGYGTCSETVSTQTPFVYGA